MRKKVTSKKLRAKKQALKDLHSAGLKGLRSLTSFFTAEHELVPNEQEYDNFAVA